MRMLFNDPPVQEIGLTKITLPSMRKLFALLVLLALFSATNAVFFFLEEGKQFCFYEDINEDTPVIVSYTIPSLDDSLRQKMHEIVPTVCNFKRDFLTLRFSCSKF